jgi:hypothetical protein
MTNAAEMIARLRDDPVFFAEEIWNDRNLNRYAPLGEEEKDIIRFACGIGLPNKFRGILAPRKIGKTHFGTAVLALWRLFRDHDRRILIVSKSQGEAKKTVKLLRDWIDTIWFLQHLRPGPNQRDNRDMFDVGPSSPNRQASVTAMGIDGQLPGNRAHTIIPDDVETPANTETFDARNKLDEAVKEFKFILYGELPTDTERERTNTDPTEIVYIGTYHHEESLYLKLSEPARGYLFRSWPILYPRRDQDILNLAPLIQDRLERGEKHPGDIVFAHRFDRVAIADLEAEGTRSFGMQCMLVRNLGEVNRYPLRLADIMVLDLDPRKAPASLTWGKSDSNGSTAITDLNSLGFGTDRFHRPVFIDREYVPYGPTIMFIDPSGRGADNTGVAIGSLINALIYVRHVKGYPGGSSAEAMLELATAAARYRVSKIVIEDNFGRGMFQQLLEPVVRSLFVKPGESTSDPDGWGCNIESVNATGQKELRIIDTLEPVIGNHRVVFDRSVAANTDLQHQITRITRQPKCLKHDDEIDALAGMVKAFQQELAGDPREIRRRQEEDALLYESLAFARECGLTDTSDNVINHRGFKRR